MISNSSEILTITSVSVGVELNGLTSNRTEPYECDSRNCVSRSARHRGLTTERSCWACQLHTIINTQSVHCAVLTWRKDSIGPLRQVTRGPLQYVLQASLLPHSGEVILYLLFDRTIRNAADEHLEVMNESEGVELVEDGSALGEVFVKTSLEPCF